MGNDTIKVKTIQWDNPELTLKEQANVLGWVATGVYINYINSSKDIIGKLKKEIEPLTEAIAKRGQVFEEALAYDKGERTLSDSYYRKADEAIENFLSDNSNDANLLYMYEMDKPFESGFTMGEFTTKVLQGIGPLIQERDKLSKALTFVRAGVSQKGIDNEEVKTILNHYSDLDLHLSVMDDIQKSLLNVRQIMKTGKLTERHNLPPMDRKSKTTVTVPSEDYVAWQEKQTKIIN